MQYIIIAIIVIAIVLALCKHILFNPRINSALCIIAFIVLSVLCWNTKYRFAVIIFALAIIDCIRDIVLAEEWYESIDIGVDAIYVIKSILTILTIGISRAVNLIFVIPIFSAKISSDITSKMKLGYPIEESGSSIYGYFYLKKIDKLLKRGKIISNAETLQKEESQSRKRLDKLYPKSLIAKLADLAIGDEEVKKKRKIEERRFDNYYNKLNRVYISADFFSRYPTVISNAMKKRTKLSVDDIKNINELKCLNINANLGRDSNWSNFFIIKALTPLVENGTFTDEVLNDDDVLDNHVYWYTQSEVQPKVIDGDNDPRLALDNDDDDDI